MNPLKRNIRLFLWQRFFHDFLLLAPILIPFYQYNQLGAFAFYLSQSTYALTVFIMEVPSGYLADVIGRKKTLVYGAILFPLGILLYASSSSLPMFLAAECLMAVANSMRSGSDSALLFDTLSKCSRVRDYSSIEGKGHQFARLGTGIASISGGLLASVSLRLPFWLNVLAGLIVVPMVFALVEPERHRAPGEKPLQNILKISKDSLNNPEIRPFVLYTGLIGSVSIISLWAYFLYYQTLSIPLGLFGILFAAFQFSAALGARCSTLWASRIGPHRVLRLSLAISPILLLVGLIKSPVMLIPIMLHPMLWNAAIPVLLEQINKKTSSQVRATVLSLANMGVSFGYVLIGPVFGLLSDRLPLSLCLILLSLLFLAASLPLLHQTRLHWSDG